MCFQKYMKSNKGLMKWALYKKIIDEGAVNGLAAIKLQVRGESFLHPDLMRCIKYAKEKGIMDVQITTNGTLLDEEKSRKIIESGLDMIIFSLDSNHRISYENSGKKSYDEVLSSITNFITLRDKMGLKRPLTRLQFSLEPEETPEEVAQRFGSIKDEVDWAFANEIFYVKEDGQPINQNKYGFLPCSILWQRMVVHYNGLCTVCCRDYACECKLGDANEQTIKEIWNGPEMKKIRETHRLGQREKVPICRFCDLYLIEK